MGSYSTDVKSTHLTASGAVFAGPSRILSIYYVSDGTAGTITIKDGGASGTSLAVIDVPIGGTSAGEPWAASIDIPGNGLYCATSSYATLSGVDKVTVFYG